MGLDNSCLFNRAQCYEYLVHSICPSLRWRKLLENADALVHDWIFSLWRSCVDRLSLVDEVFSFTLFCVILVFFWFLLDLLFMVPEDGLILGYLNFSPQKLPSGRPWF